MKKQLFIALSFATLTGIMHQACGMDEEQKKLNSVQDDPAFNQSFINSQAKVYDESKDSFLSLTPDRSIFDDEINEDSVENSEKQPKDVLTTDNTSLPVTFNSSQTGKTVDLSNTSSDFTIKTPVRIPKTYKVTIITNQDTDPKACTILDGMVENKKQATLVIDPKTNNLSITTGDETSFNEKDTVHLPLVPITSFNSAEKKEILDRFTGLENTITTMNTKFDKVLSTYMTKAKSKQSYLSRTYNFTQFLGYTFLASFGIWTISNMIKKSNGIQDAAATLFKSKDGLLGLATLSIGLPNMYPLLVKTFWPKTPLYDLSERVKAEQKELASNLPPENQESNTIKFSSPEK